MALFILLDRPLGQEEKDKPVHTLKPTRHRVWAESMGFMAEYSLPLRFARYATKDVIPEAYDPDSVKAMEEIIDNGLLRLKEIKKVLDQNDYEKRLETIEEQLVKIGDEKESLLGQARSFVIKTLAKNGILGSDPTEGRDKDRQDRVELEKIYQNVKNSQAYLELESEEKGLIQEHRLLLESASFPKNEEEAAKDMEGTGIRIMHDRHCPKTLVQRQSELRLRRRKLKTYSKAMEDFSSLLAVITRKHAMVGLTMDLQRPSKKTFLATDQKLFSLFPFPGRTIVVVRPQKPLANEVVNCHNNQRT